jgi:GTP-binding protein HflX
MLPRLRGWGESLSRQAGGRVAGGGGIGTRGPGETKLETDRRRLRARISRLQRDITNMSTGRKVQRGQRQRREVPSVVIAGYTNAGKSSLLNKLTGAGVLVEDALFATLDPSVRRATSPSGRAFTLTDTVGFVRHLPHQLVEAFRSTLEETAEADLILHVVDGSDPEPEAQLAAVRSVLAEIGAAHVPELVVVNKIDSADPVILQGLRAREPGSLSISAKTGTGLAALADAIEAALPRLDVQVKVTVPYSRGDLVARAHAAGEVLTAEHTAHGTLLEARVPPGLAVQLEAAQLESAPVEAAQL